MAGRGNWVPGRGLAAAWIAGLVIVAAGCGTMGPPHEADLPSGLQAVGGGLVINWKAPVEGTAYLVERTSSRVIETRSLNEGELYDFEIHPGEVIQTFEVAFGVPLADARFVLYFKPTDPKSGAP